MRTRVIALGERTRGDDAVGLAVLERLRGRVSEGVELCAAADEVELLALLATPQPVVLIDALLGEPVGEVREVAPEWLASHRRSAVSTHGLGVGQVIALARALWAETLAPRIAIVAVTIEKPEGFREALSPTIAAAVERAAELAMALAEGAGSRSGMRPPTRCGVS